MHNPITATSQRPHRRARFIAAGVAALAFALAGHDSVATTPTGSLGASRYAHTASTLPDGRVLVAGGQQNPGNPASMIASAEIYDPATATFASTAALAVARAEHATATLPDGRILVVGGLAWANGASTNLASAEIYDPTSGAWSATGSMATPRRSPLALALADGRVLVAGGDATVTSTEIYDPASGTWSASGSLATPRSAPVAAVLADGSVLVAGGSGSGSTYYASAERWDPATGVWSATGSLVAARANATATTLADGKVLVAGGYNGAYLGTSELYDPATGTFAQTGALVVPRTRHVATKLPDGKVAISGGSSSTGSEASGEVYDPSTGLWRAAGWMSVPRQAQTLSPLPDGNVLVAAGLSAGAPTAAAEIFYPSCVGAVGALVPASQSFASAGGNASVALDAPSTCGWSITRVPSWMTVTSALSGVGSATVSYTVAPMTTTGGRGATPRIADVDFPVNQTGICDPASTASFYPTSRSFTPAGGSDSISAYYSSSCQLTATNVPSWITITSGTGGYGSGTVTYTVAPNTGAYRFATMRVGNKNYQVTQSAPPPVCDPAYVPTLNPASQTFAAGGGSVTVNTTQSAGCTLTVGGVPSWITVTSTFSYTDSGVRYGQVALSIASNATGAQRSATLTIATTPFVVTQNP